jgi:CRP/FNR family transcriptional regulator, anaerobic regulatory protein
MITGSAEASDAGRPSISRERPELALPSSFVRFRKGELLYREGERAEALFNIVTGVVKAYMALKGGTQHIVAFSFADDLVGLAQEDKHTCSAEALTAVTAYRMPIVAINARLRSDPDLEFHLLSQLTHELRQAQAHAFLLSRHRAITRIGIFLRMLEAHQKTVRVAAKEIYVPMKRSDIGAYVGISLEAVGRSFRTLVNRGAIVIRDRRHVQIINSSVFDAAISDKRGRRSAGADG